MNGLSWLLYIGGVASNLGSFFCFLGVIFFAAFVITFFMALIQPDDDKHTDTPSTVAVEWAKKARYGFLAGLIVFGSLSAVMPSKDTVYAMAASEVGEKIVTNPQVMKTTNKGFEALNHWLDKQIEDTPDANNNASADNSTN